MRKKVISALLALCLMLLSYAFCEEAKTYDALLEAHADQLNAGHVTAFLEIPGLDFLLPVMQHPEDNGFYLKHNALGEESPTGALYTEFTYNSFDFSDPVTVIYGRRMEDGSMFGSLQENFSARFDELRVMKLYLPGETNEYTVIAAIPFSNMHIMYSYNFRHSRIYEAFFDEVYATRRPGARLDFEMRPESDEKVLILSTGLRGDVTQRYLVIAKINRTETN